MQDALTNGQWPQAKGQELFHVKEKANGNENKESKKQRIQKKTWHRNTKMFISILPMKVTYVL